MSADVDVTARIGSPPSDATHWRLWRADSKGRHGEALTFEADAGPVVYMTIADLEWELIRERVGEGWARVTWSREGDAGMTSLGRSRVFSVGSPRAQPTDQAQPAAPVQPAAPALSGSLGGVAAILAAVQSGDQAMALVAALALQEEARREARREEREAAQASADAVERERRASSEREAALIARLGGGSSSGPSVRELELERELMRARFELERHREDEGGEETMGERIVASAAPILDRGMSMLGEYLGVGQDATDDAPNEAEPGPEGV